MSIVEYCRNVNFELYELIIFLFALALVTLMVLVVKKIVLAFKTERKIDHRLRETRARISRVVTEIEDTLTRAKTEDTQQFLENVKQNTLEEEVLCIQEVSRVTPKEKKTRAMSMEERWAEFDQKRSMRGSLGKGTQ